MTSGLLHQTGSPSGQASVACRVSKVLPSPLSWPQVPSPPVDVTSALTWGMGLAVILQVIQAPAYHLHGHLVLPRPHCQPQLGLQDAACPGPDGPAAIHLHSQTQHCPTELIGKGWRVTPATFSNWTRPSGSQGLRAQLWGGYPHPHHPGAHQRNPHEPGTRPPPTAQVLAALPAPWRQSVGLTSQPGG